MIVGRSRKFGVVKTTFAYTGASQYYVVPGGVTSLNFKSWGKAGGGDGTAGGGAGTSTRPT